MASISKIVCLTDKQVAEILVCSPKQVWEQSRNNPTFPQPIRLFPMTTRWLQHEIFEYILAQRDARADQPKAA